MVTKRHVSRGDSRPVRKKSRSQSAAQKAPKSPKRSKSQQIAGSKAGPGAQVATSAAPISRRKPMPAWNDVEIDEQRETAGRPDPAFLPDQKFADDDLAEELGEEFLLAATSGEQVAQDVRNEDFPEDMGGPFVVTTARTEFAYGTDPSNPEDAEPEAFPTASSLEPSVNPVDAEGGESGEATS